MDVQDFLVQESDGIVVSARPVLIDENYDNRFWWGYYLCIENNTDSKIQLIGKNWRITDEAGNNYVDDSIGFKGELPELEPGEYFEFTSEAPLNFANAVFYGSCQVLREGQTAPHNIKIPTFNLSTVATKARRIVN
ncbi:MAG: ApaG domain [Alphaproteobacteria bacterium]|nr:ApaG domain [Alphaproteobacteria bacterium]